MINEEKNRDEITDKICEECNKEEESVKQNLILTGYKVCNSVKYQRLFFLFSLYLKLVKNSFYS